MQDISGRENKVSPEGVIDIEPYFRAIPRDDLLGHLVPEFSVQYVARGSDGCYDHVLIPTSTANVFVVIVVSLHAATVYGHRLLDLNELYGLAPLATQ